MSDPTPPISAPYELLPPLDRPVQVFVAARRRPRYWINALLLLTTMFTTLVVGARLEYNFLNNLPAFSLGENVFSFFPLFWVLDRPSRLLLGIPFAATLMLILLAHELGHYLMARRYGVTATLPFFIPAPTLIGTMGAFIRIKSPIRSRAALFDIGIAGPIAGFVVAVATLFFSLLLSKPMPAGVPEPYLQFGYPLIFRLMHGLIPGASSYPLAGLYLHPTAIAAWAGMFATALNLLPGGQLDGGHLVFAIAPRAHKWVSRLTVLALVPLAWFWLGWLLWAVLLRVSGMRHPQVPTVPDISRGRRLLFLCAILMLVLTFAYSPFQGNAAGGLRDVLMEFAHPN
jgi:membrane-associated protease RseP (regulator of RpoE activity)